jgi:hypothetical protein
LAIPPYEHEGANSSALILEKDTGGLLRKMESQVDRRVALLDYRAFTIVRT